MSSHDCITAFLVTLFCGVLGSHPADAGQRTLNPTIVGIGNDVDFDGHWDTADPGCCLAYNGLPSTYNYRSAVEFDLASIPSGAFILNATFNIEYHGASGSPGPSLQFNQYVGNGALDLTDFEQIDQIGPLRDAFGPGDGTLLYKIPVAPVVQSFVNNGNRYLGVMIQNVIRNQTELRAPFLSVTFIPEPASLVLAAIASGAGLLRRRRS